MLPPVADQAAAGAANGWPYWSRPEQVNAACSPGLSTTCSGRITNCARRGGSLSFWAPSALAAEDGLVQVPAGVGQVALQELELGLVHPLLRVLVVVDVLPSEQVPRRLAHGFAGVR